MNKFHEEKKSTCNKFDEQQSARNEFNEQNKHATKSMNKIIFVVEKSLFTIFTKRKINMQQVSCTKTTRYKLRELNQFHDEKTQHAPRFTNKNQDATSFTNKNQRAPSSTTKISTKQVP